MLFLKTLSSPVVKLFKGTFILASIWVLASLSLIVFDSCNKANYNTSEAGKAASRFNNAMEEAKSKLGAISLGNSNENQARFGNPEGKYYIKFPNGTSSAVINKLKNTPTIVQLTNSLEFYGASINDSIQPDADLSIVVPEQDVMNVLQPLVSEAKNYLIAKGATHQQIAEMIQEENAQEIDLIPYVKALIRIEQDQNTVRNFSTPFVSEANAKLPKFVECGIQALGGDALYALSQSGASSWTWGTMKSAFRSVAKKFLGPIGVAVAVVTFGICMLS